jgi:hypothetical protein
MKHKTKPILFKRLLDAPRMSASTAAREYQTVIPGFRKEAAAVVRIKIIAAYFQGSS